MGETLPLILKTVAVTFGVLGGAFIGNLLAPWLTRSKKGQSGTTLGGALLGGLIMWLAFNHSGSGPGFGLGGGPGLGSGHGTGDTKSTGDKKKPGESPIDKDKKETAEAPTVLRIGVLGGERVLQGRFYRLENDAPRTRPELEQAVLERKRQQPSLKVLEILLYTDSVARDNPAVTALEDWAREHGLTAKTVSVEKTAP